MSISDRRELGSSGIFVSPLGFGASPLGDEFGRIDDAEGIQAVHEALKSGINFFDVSPYYGRTKAESVLGRALRDVPRDSYVLATKVGRYDVDTFDFSAERVKRSVEESMKRLNVDVLDIVHCHDMEFCDLNVIAQETIPALLELKQAGKIRAIGITGYPLEIFPYVLTCAPPRSIDVILSYCNYTIQNDRLLQMAKGLRRDYDVGVINASPLCMGLLTDGGCPSWHPGDLATKNASAVANDICKARSSEADLAKLSLQFALSADKDIITSTLVGIGSREILRKNVKFFNDPVDKELLRDVQDAFAKVHNLTWSSGRYLGNMV